MANDISPGSGRDWTLTYTTAAGTPGLIDPTVPPVITQTPPDLAQIFASPFNTSTGKLVVHVDHNGSVGELALTAEVDGDLGAGTAKISAGENFTMKPPLGATGVTGDVGDERPTPEINPLPGQRKK